MFAKTGKRHCFDDKYGSYNTLEEAEFACANDEKCEKVYDQGCNNIDDFTLCPWNSTEFVSSVSCIYTKPGKYGNEKYIISCYQENQSFS